jgi:hypothetical protein
MYYIAGSIRCSSEDDNVCDNHIAGGLDLPLRIQDKTCIVSFWGGENYSDVGSMSTSL